jgi:bifunctional polynucleotide phosphatase/kinase
MKRSAAKAALILEQVQSLGKFEVLGDGGLLQATFGEWVRQDQFRLAGFDMDYTLIKTLSGKRFAIDSRDWTFLFDEVPHKLQELNKQNFRVVVFTNQGGVAAGNTSIKDLQAKFSAIHKACNIPMMFLAAIAAHDKHRKPSTGMFAHLEAEYGSVDKSQSFYCGDAAGRLATKTAQKDFSADDLKFAWNTGLKFETPESLFLG